MKGITNRGRLNGLRTGVPAVLWIMGAAMLIWSLAVRLVYASDRAASWDAVDFALALDRFDLLAMQPHFPGYPYFIMGGMAVRSLVADPVRALSVLNAVAMFTATVPVFLLARRYLDALTAFLTAAVVQTMPYLWVLGTQPMSEGVGTALVWWYVWAVVRTYEHQSVKRQLAAVAFFGMLSGVRISFFPVGIGLLAVWWRDWRVHRSWGRLALYAGAFGGSQLLWAAVLLLSEGSVTGFAELAAGFVSGHFNEWGGGVGASSVGWSERLYRFVVGNGLWTGVMGQSVTVLWAWGMAVGAAIITSFYRVRRGSRRNLAAASDGSTVPQAGLAQPLQRIRRSCRMLLLGMACCYGLWAWIGQNIDKPRHTVPMVLLLVLLALLQLVRLVRVRYASVGLVGLALIQSVSGTMAVRLQAAEVPAVYQLGEALNEKAAVDGKPFILYTWEETRVLQYMKAGFPHKRIFTFDYFQAEAAALEGHTIYVTGKVLEGFQAQNVNLDGRVQPAAEFHSSAIFDPVYSRIMLYEWVQD
jgi:hypothetical protein